MFDEAWIEVAGGNMIRLPELSARLAIGEKGPVRVFTVLTYPKLITSLSRIFCHSLCLLCRDSSASYWAARDQAPRTRWSLSSALFLQSPG